MKTIEITISPTGQSQVATRGFVGGECRDASRLIEKALGKTTDERMTPEFYQTSTRSAVTSSTWAPSAVHSNSTSAGDSRVTFRRSLA